MLNGTQIFERLESNVRGYCRSFPCVFSKGKDSFLYDETNQKYIDFFAGAGALNYGHNPESIKQSLIDFIQEDRVMHSLDMFTDTKRKFLSVFETNILKPRGLNYKVQFCGPTGANSVEAALKLARLATGRVSIGSFTGGWHGMTSGCLSVTGNRDNRLAAGFPMSNVIFFPYPEGPRQFSQSIEYMESLFSDPNSGLDKPGAIILETIQAEGGIYCASVEWLKALRAFCDRHQVLLIVDDVQIGCGRSGDFFSFERAGIIPDIVCLSKSIGGYGLPMSLLLFKKELDVWKPGQHTGTFRGNQLAMLASTIAIETYWSNQTFAEQIKEKEQKLYNYLSGALQAIDPKIELRGLGLIWGIDFTHAGGEVVAKQIGRKCFENGLIIERCGRDDVVLKILPPLTIEESVLFEGCDILLAAIQSVVGGEALSSCCGEFTHTLSQS